MSSKEELHTAIREHLETCNVNSKSYDALITRIEQFMKENDCVVKVAPDPESCCYLSVTGENLQVRKARTLLGSVEYFPHYLGDDYEEWDTVEYGD